MHIGSIWKYQKVALIKCKRDSDGCSFSGKNKFAALEASFFSNKLSDGAKCAFIQIQRLKKRIRTKQGAF